MSEFLDHPLVRWLVTIAVSALVSLLPIDAVMWFVVPLLAVRSGSNLSLAIYRIAGHSGRYNAMMLIENVVGFLAAIALAWAVATP